MLQMIRKPREPAVPSTTDAPVIPTLREVSPAYGKAVDRRNEMKHKRDAIAAERDALIASSGRKAQDSAAIAAQQEERINKILRGEIVAGALNPNADASRIKELGLAISDLDKAIRVLDRLVEDERFRASNLVCAKMSDFHRNLVRRISSALIELHAASLAYDEFSHQMKVNEVFWSQLRAMHPNQFGDPRDRYGRMGQYLHEAAEYHFISQAEIPAELTR